jgi:hypothetical protein
MNPKIMMAPLRSTITTRPAEDYILLYPGEVSSL